MMTVHVLFTGLVSKDFVSGGDQLFLDIAPRLPKDVGLVIITPEFARKYFDSIKRDNMVVKTFGTNWFDFKPNPIFIFLTYLVRTFQVYRILKREEKITIIYSCSDVAYADIWSAFMITSNKKIKWVSRIYHVLLKPGQRQGNLVVNWVAYHLQKLSFWMMRSRSVPILALNDKLKDEILALGFPKDKVGVLGAGIDFELIRKFQPTKKYDYDVVVLGRLAPVKGIFDMIKIWERVHAHNPNWKVVWIGGGTQNYQDKVKELIQKGDFKESFDLAGFLEKTEVYNILKSAQVFLCPDHENGWGLAVCEAMSAGLPVVAYDIAIFGGVYKQGFIKVPLFDTNSFASELIRVLEDKGLRQRLAQEAKEQAAEFDHDKVVAELMVILKS